MCQWRQQAETNFISRFFSIHSHFFLDYKLEINNIFEENHIFEVNKFEINSLIEINWRKMTFESHKIFYNNFSDPVTLSTMSTLPKSANTVTLPFGT